MLIIFLSISNCLQQSLIILEFLVFNHSFLLLHLHFLISESHSSILLRFLFGNSLSFLDNCLHCCSLIVLLLCKESKHSFASFILALKCIVHSITKPACPTLQRINKLNDWWISISHYRHFETIFLAYNCNRIYIISKRRSQEIDFQDNRHPWRNLMRNLTGPLDRGN